MQQLRGPAKTRLYPLPPRGLGTYEVESLTSYVRRLAAAHVVTPAALIRHEVLIPLRDARGQRQLAFHPVLCTESINGPSRNARAVVEALAGLTLQRGLAQTTFLDRDTAIEWGRAFRATRAWCPECLASEDAYDRLAWSLSAVSTCLQHECLLENACRECGQPHRPWHPSATLNQCPRCGASLVGNARSAGVISAMELRLRELLEHLFTGGVVSRRAVAAGVAAMLVGSSWGEISQRSGVNFATISGVRKEAARARLDGLLGLIVASGRDVPTFLAQPTVAVRTRRVRSKSRLTARARSFLARRAGIETRLRAALGQSPVPSVKGFAQGNRTTHDTLSKHWPDLTKALSERFRAQESRRRAEREAREMEDVRRAVFAARRTGHGTRRTVQKLLGRPGLFRQSHVRRAYAEAIDEELVPEVSDAA